MKKIKQPPTNNENIIKFLKKTHKQKEIKLYTNIIYALKNSKLDFHLLSVSQISLIPDRVLLKLPYFGIACLSELKKLVDETK